MPSSRSKAVASGLQVISAAVSAQNHAHDGARPRLLRQVVAQYAVRLVDREAERLRHRDGQQCFAADADAGSLRRGLSLHFRPRLGGVGQVVVQRLHRRDYEWLGEHFGRGARRQNGRRGARRQNGRRGGGVDLGTTVVCSQQPTLGHWVQPEGNNGGGGLFCGTLGDGAGRSWRHWRRNAETGCVATQRRLGRLFGRRHHFLWRLQV